ncbi:hypothetical protein KVM43_05660 [Helicobacter pylori]|nr:hypothetical protein KVM43_05660 [Helicobacter pylori]
MANSFLEFTPIIALMGRLSCNNLFKFKKTLSQKPLKSEIALQDELFVVFIKNDRFLAEFLKKKGFLLTSFDLNNTIKRLKAI